MQGCTGNFVKPFDFSYKDKTKQRQRKILMKERYNLSEKKRKRRIKIALIVLKPQPTRTGSLAIRTRLVPITALSKMLQRSAERDQLESVNYLQMEIKRGRTSRWLYLSPSRHKFIRTRSALATRRIAVRSDCALIPASPLSLALLLLLRLTLNCCGLTRRAAETFAS